MTEAVKAVPDIEYFYGMPYKYFCGKCGRCIMITGDGIAAVKAVVKKCRWCGTEVNWEDVKQDE